MIASPKPPRIVPPWAATAAGLTAMTTLFLASGPTPILPTLALGLLAVYLFGARFEMGTRPIQFTRLLLFGTIFALRGERETNLMDAWGPAQSLDTIALAAAAELVIRAWQRDAWGGTKRMLLLSGLVMLIGCSTDNERLIRITAPLYFLCVVLALRADRPHAARAPRRVIIMAGGLIALTLGLGAVVTRQFETHKAQIMEWGMEWGMEQLGERARPPDTGAGVSGLSKTPVLGSTFNQPGSSARLLKVVGGLNDPYLHQMAFEDYYNGRWGPQLNRRDFGPADLRPDAPGPRARVTRYVNDDGYLSAPLSCAGIDVGPRASTTWPTQGSGPVRLEPDDVVAYDIIHGPNDTYQGPLCTPPTPTETARCLQMPPEIDSKVRAIARRIAAESADPRLRVEGVVRFLMRNNAYSLTTQRGSGDPISNFILQRKSAHCEYFASAATILLRGAGIPTRYAIGYYAHEGDGPGVTVVRAQDAHAWAESWLPGVGWVVVDATPGNGRPDHTAKSSWWWKWRDRWQDLTLAFRVWVSGLGRRQRWALIGGLAAVLIASSLLRWWQVRRTKQPAFAYAIPSEALRSLAGRFEAFLARRGRPCPPDRPWQEHLAAPEEVTAAIAPLDMDRAQAFVDEYNRVRFGDAPSLAALSALDATLRQLENADK